MRPLLIIIVTLVVVAGGFYAVMKSQTASPRQAMQSQPAGGTTLPTSRPGDRPDPQQMVGQGERVWVQSFDSKSGELAHEFYAEKYDPVGGDTVDVIAPQARFYLGHAPARQMLVIKGTRGTVNIPNAAGGRDRLQGGAAPTRGELQQVSIELFNSPQDITPQIVCTMPNAAFDNDQFRIYTEGYRNEKGDLVAADQVPVTVRGKYEFDGKGLEIRWNERDRRLQSLEVVHGDKLVVRDVESLKLSSTRSMGAAPMPAQWLVSQTHGRGAHATGGTPLAEALVAADPAAAGEALPQTTQSAAPKKKKKKPKPTRIPTNVKIERDDSTPIFRATLHDNVTIFENEVQIGTADRLFADFILDFSATKPGESPDSPATAPSGEAATVPGAKPKPATRPDDKDAIKGPIIVRWTGKLRVEPTNDPEVALPQPGQFNVALAGEPARLFRGGAEVVGSLVSWRSGDGAFSVGNSEKTPQVMLKDARGATIWTESIEYGGVGHTAVLTGKSKAEIPVPADDPAAAPQIVNASWNDTCQIELAGDSFDALQINKAELEGEVTLKHPQISGRSNTLTLDFESTVDEAGQNSLSIRQMIAAGAADYTIIDSRQQSQSIRTDRLEVFTARTPDGRTYPSSINAHGNVHTKDIDRELSASQLSLKLAPAKAAKDGDIDIESLLAEGKVQVSMADGQFAAADRLTVTLRDGAPQVELIGLPNASVGDKDSTLVGPTIRIEPDSGSASVVGAGSLTALHRASAGDPPRKINVSWMSGLQLDGKDNLATLNGPVTVQIPEEDGTQNTATGGKMLIVLADKPSTQPSDDSTHARNASAAGSSAFAAKIIKSYQLLDAVEVKSILSDATGEVLRRVHLFAARLDYEQAAQRTIIPGAGRMLVQDNRKTQRQPEESQLFSGGGMRGATAFEWQKVLSYDEAAHRLEMIGAVRIVHQGADDSEPFEIAAEKVAAEIEANSSDASSAEKVKLRKLSASGAVNFISRQVRFVADQVEFDPATHLLTARAGGSGGAELFQEDGDSRGSFSELIFDARKKEIVSMKGFRATVRR